MISELTLNDTNDWLLDLQIPQGQLKDFPLNHILQHALFYPSSGFDGDPIRYLAGHINQFIYVDYGHSQHETDLEIFNHGLKGYRVVASRDVTEQELAPNGVSLNLGQGDRNFDKRHWLAKRINRPFCRWYVFEREAEFDESHGPARLSLVYLCADGAAAYQAIFNSNNAVPAAIAIIQPGHGFGGNWTNFEDESEIMAQSVYANAAGLPPMLLFGGIGGRHYYETPCWSRYSERICFLQKSGGGHIGLWQQPAK